MLRLLSGLLLACPLVLVGISVGPAPAHAAVAAPSLSDLSTSTPGHVTGTVTGGPDAQSAWVCFSGCHVNTGHVSGGWLPLDPTTHSVTFDLPKWGYAKGEVSAVVCANPAAIGCTPNDGTASAQTISTELTTTDVRPAISFSPTDGKVGVGEDLVVSASDPAGGGVLRAYWDSQDGDLSATTDLDRNGDTVVKVGEGVGTVVVWRCGTLGVFPRCSPFDPVIELPVEAHRKDDVYAGVRTPATVAHPWIDVEVQSRYGDSEITVDWQLTDARGNPLPEPPTGRASGTTTGEGTFAFSIDAGALATGVYSLTGTVRVTSPDWGEFTTALPAEGPWIDVDTEAPDPTTMTASRSVVRPESSTPTSTVSIAASGPNVDNTHAFVLIGPNGGTLRPLLTSFDPVTGARATFDGRSDHGSPLPSGRYTIALRDPAGNVSSRTVAVRVERLVTKTYRATVTPRGTLVDRYVGRCSTLRTPASRGWSGSLGYYANSRCRSTSSVDSTVASQHRLLMPAAASYLDVQLSAYGGASRGHSRSTATMLYDNPRETAAVGQRSLGAKLGTWAAPRVTASKVLRPVSGRRYLYWEVGTWSARRYDVKSFTVTVRYRIWS